MKTENRGTNGKKLRRADRELGDFSRRESASYLVGMMGQTMIYNIIGAALSLYYTDVAMVDIAVVGLIFTVARVWDAINDPIAGVIVEKTKSKYGKSRPWLRFIPYPIAIVTTLLFIPLSSWPMGARIAYLVVMYFLWSPFYTLGDIPLWSLPSRMVPDEARRTKLISSARFIGGFGAIVTAIYAPIKNALGKIDLGIFPNVGLINYDGYFSQEQGYLLTTLLICIVGALLFSRIFPNVRERVNTYDSDPVTFKGSFKLILKNKPYLRVMISGILGCTKTLLLTAGMYFCKWVLGDGYEGIWVIILGAPYLIGTFVSYSLTPRLGVKFTKKKLYIFTSLLSAVPVALMFLLCYKNLDNLHSAPMMAVMLIMLGCFGILSGFTTALQPVMSADSIDYLEYRYGERKDGLFASGITFLAKLSSGIAILISNVFLGTVNYTETINHLSAEIATATNAGSTYALNFAATYPKITVMMFVLITIVPAVGCVLQAIPMFGYEIGDNELKEMRAANEEKRKEIDASKAQ
ncbi:MAG: MFS transporter [Oscillospiraceae bacterium]|nr:MFS transporter [Oscillospiraceae bacterium]